MGYFSKLTNCNPIFRNGFVCCIHCHLCKILTQIVVCIIIVPYEKVVVYYIVMISCNELSITLSTLYSNFITFNFSQLNISQLKLVTQFLLSISHPTLASQYETCVCVQGFVGPVGGDPQSAGPAVSTTSLSYHLLACLPGAASLQSTP